MTATARTTAGPPLRPREDADLATRIARSAAARPRRGSGRGVVDDVHGWLDERRAATRFAVDRVPFGELDAWSFAEDTGNLVHRSGRFFTVEGLHVRRQTDDDPWTQWHQPVLVQPEVGILGILAKEIDGVLHFLMQAKMEPGNPNLLQLSPTVQATRSNYSKVHRGAAVRHLEYFVEPGRGRVLSDVLQSEHGSWFLHKRNRNMIVEVADDVPPHDDFRWLTLGQLAALLHQDNVVNMDARSVLAGLPGPRRTHALHPDTAVLSWLARERARHTVRADRTPLATVPGWIHGDRAVHRADGRYFAVVAVAVQAGNREVAQWTQPLFAPCGEGVVAFLTRTFDGVPHVLAAARPEGGLLDTAEVGPTVQCTPGNHAHLPPAQRPPFLDLVLDPDPGRVRYDVRHSEEGGRFLDSVSRYLVVDADEGQAPRQAPPGFQWLSHAQLCDLARYGHHVSVQARTLLTCLNAMAAGSP
ncbi:NDP-hexose 2,3-dehydratase family protein [Streptomyces sp. NPDC020412]|uniref:NDP-hexose 2,3-dehydratase family protein n=1 Tax=Streptomyces sp. NPDC020412 TaxID=3365073 RepID=UPI00379D315C